MHHCGRTITKEINRSVTTQLRVPLYNDKCNPQSVTLLWRRTNLKKLKMSASQTRYMLWLMIQPVNLKLIKNYMYTVCVPQLGLLPISLWKKNYHWLTLNYKIWRKKKLKKQQQRFHITRSYRPVLPAPVACYHSNHDHPHGPVRKINNNASYMYALLYMWLQQDTYM